LTTIRGIWKFSAEFWKRFPAGIYKFNPFTKGQECLAQIAKRHKIETNIKYGIKGGMDD